MYRRAGSVLRYSPLELGRHSKYFARLHGLGFISTDRNLNILGINTLNITPSLLHQNCTKNLRDGSSHSKMDLVKSASRDKKSLRDGVEHDGPAETGDMELLGS